MLMHALICFECLRSPRGLPLRLLSAIATYMHFEQLVHCWMDWQHYRIIAGHSMHTWLLWSSRGSDFCKKDRDALVRLPNCV